MRTTFEGIATWKPNNHTEILESQYGREAITSKIFDVIILTRNTNIAKRRTSG